MIKSITLLCVSLISFTIQAQVNFTRNLGIPVNHNGPLPLAWSGGINFALFSEIDLDGNSVPDLFVFDRSNNRVLTYVNNGSPGVDCWEYAPQYADQFPEMKGWAFLFDYNCDNKPDLLTVNVRNNGIAQYRNDSQGGAITFTLVDSSIKYTNVGPIAANILASSFLVPCFDDIDGDGDMDIIGQQFMCMGGFALYKNMSMEHYGTCDSLSDYELSQNIWGSFRLRSGAYSYASVGFWNQTCFLYSPVFNNNNYYPYEIARRDDTYASLRTIDIDGDGDKDLLIGDSQAKNSLLVINGGSAGHAVMTSQDTLFPSYDIPSSIHTFSAHAFVDADNDGVKDLIVSQSEYDNIHGILRYRNTGTNQIPVFNYVNDNFLQRSMIDVGEAATPVLFDYDSDGLLDLLIGNKWKTVNDSVKVTGLTLYRNSGTAGVPSFDFITDDFGGIQSLLLTGQIFPAFGDLDNDGDSDMLLGLEDGNLFYFNNTAGPGVPPVYGSSIFSYMGIDVGQACTPQLFDLDKDGLLDIVSGGKNGLIKYYRNSGSLATPFFSSTATSDTLGGIIVQTIQSVDGYSVPFLFDQAGETRLLVSAMKGEIYLYGNIDGNLGGNFTVTDTVLSRSGGNRYGHNLTVSGGDLNNDTLVDMVVGYFGGGVQIFYQDLTTHVSHLNKKDDFVSVNRNPVSDILEVTTTGPFEKSLAVLFDMQGRLIARIAIEDGTAGINLTGIPQGTYMLRLSTGNFSVSRKIVVVR